MFHLRWFTRKRAGAQVYPRRLKARETTPTAPEALTPMTVGVEPIDATGRLLVRGRLCVAFVRTLGGIF
jgi:hypothetical protein